MNNTPAQLSPNSLPRRLHPPNAPQLRSSVWQDNPAPPPASPASPQPAPLPKQMSADTLNRKTPRTQNRRIARKSAVKVTSWVKPVIKQEIEKLARGEGLSISAISASLLEKALQQSLYLRYAALIDPIIEKAIGKHLRSYSTRIAMLLVRVAFDAGQTRNLVTNILSRQPGVDKAVLEHILNSSSKAAKGKITRSTPQLEELIAEVEHWFAERDIQRNE